MLAQKDVMEKLYANIFPQGVNHHQHQPSQSSQSSPQPAPPNPMPSSPAAASASHGELKREAPPGQVDAAAAKILEQ
eukprot:1065774-Karenia_brevis.AAC.1